MEGYNDYILKIDPETNETKVVLDTFVNLSNPWGYPKVSAGIHDLEWIDEKHGMALGQNRVFWETKDGGDTWFYSELNDTESGALISIPGQAIEEMAMDFKVWDDGSITLCNYGAQIFRYYPCPSSVEDRNGGTVFESQGPVVYPQPAEAGQQLSANLLGQGIATLIISDMSGRTVSVQEIELTGFTKIDLPSENLLGGTYMLTVTNHATGQVQSGRFVIR
ncbi:MAG: hypothetical protein Kapaf2KO_04850 [Candidatus Kapaibacteriales bacterium]